MIEYRGEKFAGYNKPKRTPNHPNKSHAVLAKEGDVVKLIRFGQQGVSGSPARKGESAADKARRASFQARHAKNIAKGNRLAISLHRVIRGGHSLSTEMLKTDRKSTRLNSSHLKLSRMPSSA